MAASSGCVSEELRFPQANVVLITIDTLRADHLGAWGHPADTSPNLDRLASRGVRFAKAISPSSWTLPAHASILTGLHPIEHGVQSPTMALPPSAPTLATILDAKGYDTFGAVSHTYLGSRWGFDRGFDRFDETAANASVHSPVAESVVSSALQWFEGRADKSTPFFAWLHIFDPHWDYSPSPPFDQRFDPNYSGSMSGAYSSLRPFIRALRPPGSADPPLSARDLQHLEALYDGEIAYADHQLGRLFHRLESLKALDNTIVVVASDHGEEFMEHGSLEGHQWTLFEEVVHVPFLLRLPSDKAAGKTVTQPVSTVHITPTVLELLGIEGDQNGLTSLITEESPAQEPAPILLDLVSNPPDPRGKRSTLHTQALRTETWKLVRDSRGSVALYSKPEIGNETENLAAKEPELLRRLTAELDRQTAALKRLPDAGTQRMSISEATKRRLESLGYAE